MSYTQVSRRVDRRAKPPPEVWVEVFGKLWHNKRCQNPGSHPHWHPKFQDIQKYPQVSQQHFSFTFSHRGLDSLYPSTKSTSTWCPPASKDSGTRQMASSWVTGLSRTLEHVLPDSKQKETLQEVGHRLRAPTSVLAPHCLKPPQTLHRSQLSSSYTGAELRKKLYAHKCNWQHY